MPKTFVVVARETIWIRYLVQGEDTDTPETIEDMLNNDMSILFDGTQFFSEDFEITEIKEA